MKPNYKEVNYPYENLANPDHDQIPDAPSTYSTEKYETPKFKPNKYVPDHETPDIDAPKYEEKDAPSTYATSTYKPKEMEPTSYAEEKEASKYEITTKYYAEKKAYESEEKGDSYDKEITTKVYKK